MSDRSTSSTEFGLMQAFNDFIRLANLFDVPLGNRNFTWSNKQPTPTLSKIDRVLLSTNWLTAFPSISLTALSMVVSDHAPLLLHCKLLAFVKKPPRMELFWFRFQEFHLVTENSWQSGTSATSPIERFRDKTETLQQALKEWNSNRFSNLDVYLSNAKTFISLFDRLEETRLLTSFEFRLRILLREQAFKLANILESKWHQRSRVKWLQSGDSNTSFFHSVASSKLRRKTISQIEADGRTITGQTDLVNAFTAFYQSLLGSSPPVSPCNLQNLYLEELDLAELAIPFSPQEIKFAVSNLANNKASGPDGLPNEFAKVKWETVQEDVTAIFNSLFDGTLNLSDYNLANIVLLPKSDSAQTMQAFRPISIINYIPKLIAKVLAGRLAPFLPDLISNSQTGFVKGRLLHENFISAREMVHHLEQS